MSQHYLHGRTDNEILWFQRRSFLQAAAAWTTMGGVTAAFAQNRSNIVQLQGDVTLNGIRLRPQQVIQSGDEIQTGPNSTLIFVIENSAFHVRQNSRLTLARSANVNINVVGLLRLFTGAVVSVWGKGFERKIVTPTLTAGIRGTGVYTEVLAEQNGRTYFCNCYGTVSLEAGSDSALSQSDYHQSFWGEIVPKNGRSLTPAKAINHSDEELEYLARLVDEPTTWQIKGKKGVKDGKGYMEELPNQMHPAEMPGR